MSDSTETVPRADYEKLKQNQQDTAKLLIRRDLALTRANDQLRALDVAKSEFISIAAHQLRTPLSAIKWIMSMLKNNDFTSEPERLNFIGKAADSTDRMISLVNDLLEVDHLESGKTTFAFVAVDLASILQGGNRRFEAASDS